MIQSQTESVEISHFGSEESVERELSARVRRIVEEANGALLVGEARRAREDAEARAKNLKASQREFAERSRALLAKSREAAARIDGELIAARPVTAAQYDNFVRLEAEQRAVLRAASQVVERLLPAAEVASLEAAAREFVALAAELRRIAGERMQRTARMMAEAADHEGEIAFDPRRTVSGLLTARADELERRAADYWKWANERRDKHQAILERIA